MNNQLAVVNNQSVSDIEIMAKAITKSGLFGIKTPDQAVALMLVAQSEGRHPASVASEFDIIQGRPALKSQAALARFQAAGGKIQWTSRGPSKCSAKFAHAQGGELEITWTMERANAAGLTGKSTWKQYPDQMLSARVVAEGVRAVFPACLNGVYLAEEVQDFDAKPAPIKVVSEPVKEANGILVEPFRNAESVKTLFAKAEKPVEVNLDDLPDAPWGDEQWWEPVKDIVFPVASLATAWLIGRGQIAEGQHWVDLQEGAYRQRILSAPEKFVAAIKEGK